MLNIAVVTYQFYKTVTRGGERHLLLLARILQEFSRVTIITTQSKEHKTWKNELKDAIEYIEKRIRVIRHPVDFQIKLREINDLNHYLHGNTNHTIEEEEDWMKKMGPYSSDLFTYLKKNKNEYDLFFFIGYANPITYYGLPLVKKKAVLIPLCHEEPSFYFKIFDQLFIQPRIIISNTLPETDSIHKRYPTHSPLITAGINIDEQKILNFKAVQKKYRLKKPYLLFVGRTERNKGIFELTEYYKQLSMRSKNFPDLVIIGEKMYSPGKDRKIKFLTSANDREKLTIIKNSLFVINPSYYESLSLVLLESWSQKIPVLVNADCKVLKKQVNYSQGGLYYDNFFEFEKMANLLIKNPYLRKELGRNGYKFYKNNYTKKVISEKMSVLVKNLIN